MKVLHHDDTAWPATARIRYSFRELPQLPTVGRQGYNVGFGMDLSQITPCFAGIRAHGLPQALLVVAHCCNCHYIDAAAIIVQQ